MRTVMTLNPKGGCGKSTLATNIASFFASAGNNPWQVRYPLELPDGRILFFQAEPCDSESCYKYALVEATPTLDGYTLDILRHDALPGGSWQVVWHESGEYIAFVIGPYGGPWYITVMRVSTGEMFVLAEEKQPPSHLIWGSPEVYNPRQPGWHSQSFY